MIDISHLLKDMKNKFWKDRIKRSVEAVLHLYKLSIHDVIISRKKINSDELYIVAVEESDLKQSIEDMKKHVKIPPPLTVIQYRHKKCLFQGSTRAVQYVLHEKMPDCIVVKLPNHLHPRMVMEANITLKKLIEKQKKS